MCGRAEGVEPTLDPNHPLNRYPWQHPRSRERGALELFLAIARDRIEQDRGIAGDTGPLPFTANEGLRVLDWLDARVRLRSPLSGGGTTAK